MNSVNIHVNNIKKQQIKITEENKKQLEKEFKEKLVILIGILTSLSIKYNNSNTYMQLKIMKDIKFELTKYKKVLIKYQDDFIRQTLKNTFSNNYDELYKIFSLSYDGSVKKSLITENDINKIINSKFFNKTLDKRIVDNTTLIFNKLNKEVKNEIIEKNDISSLVENLNDNFESLIKVQKRLLDTEETRLFNEAQKKVFSDFGVENLIWRSVLEKNTCGTCASRENQPFKIDDVDMIPVHSNCNCYWEIF